MLVLFSFLWGKGVWLLIAFCPEMFVFVIEGKDRYIEILVIELVWWLWCVVILCLTSYKKCQSCFPLLVRIIFWRDWTFDSHKEMIFLVFALTCRNSIGGEKPLSMRLLKLYRCSCYVNVPAWFIARQNYQRESCRIFWGSS